MGILSKLRYNTAIILDSDELNWFIIYIKNLKNIKLFLNMLSNVT